MKQHPKTDRPNEDKPRPTGAPRNAEARQLIEDVRKPLPIVTKV